MFYKTVSGRVVLWKRRAMGFILWHHWSQLVHEITVLQSNSLYSQTVIWGSVKSAGKFSRIDCVSRLPHVFVRPRTPEPKCTTVSCLLHPAPRASDMSKWPLTRKINGHLPHCVVQRLSKAQWIINSGKAEPPRSQLAWIAAAAAVIKGPGLAGQRVLTNPRCGPPSAHHPFLFSLQMAPVVIYFDCISFRSPVKDKHHLLWVIALFRRSNKFDLSRVVVGCWLCFYFPPLMVITSESLVTAGWWNEACHCLCLVILPLAGGWSWGQVDHYANVVWRGSYVVCRFHILMRLTKGLSTVWSWSNITSWCTDR